MGKGIQKEVLHVGEREMFERSIKSSLLSHCKMQENIAKCYRSLCTHKKGPHIYYGSLFPLGRSHLCEYHH